MFCHNCGKEIDDNAFVCPHCGVIVGNKDAANGTNANSANTNATNGTNAQTTGSNTIATVGFVLSFFIAIAGLICSIIGYRNAPQYGGKGKGLALAGIIISAVSMAIALISVIIAVAMWGSFVDELVSSPYMY